jgi:nucleoside-diphosphate-sugar epimerase
MRIFIAGATGALGRRLAPLLVDAGHQVTGTTRSAGSAGQLRSMGVEPVVLDALDRDAVMEAVGTARPDVVVHQLTALSAPIDMRRFDTSFAQTNRLRTAGTDHLLAAAQAAGARRFIAQSYTGWLNERSGGPVKTEDDPIDPNPTAVTRETVAALHHVEDTMTAASGIDALALRYGNFYGAGTSLGIGGDVLEMVRARRLPLVGGGTGVWSLIHIDDAARATAVAVERGAPGLYNIVDDDPAPVHEWLPFLAEAIGAKPPLRLPTWLVRPLLGEHGVSLMTSVRGSSNAKARRVLGWQPQFGSWRQGFRDGLGATPQARRAPEQAPPQR